MKRVLHMLDSGGMYGAEHVVLNLSRAMQAGGDYEPVIGCIVQSPGDRADLHDAAVACGIESHRMVVSNYRLPLHLPRLARSLQKLRIDIVHSHGYKASVFAFTARLLSDIRIMATCHLWFEGRGRPLKMRIMVALEKYLYRFFPVVVGVSDDILAVLSAAGIADARLRLVRNGIVMQDYRAAGAAEKHALAASLGLGPTDRCVLNAGRLTEQKAQDSIISAAARVRDACPEARFLIVGEGGLRDSLQERIDRLGLQDSVTLLGFRDDVPLLMQLADLFVLPSLDEGMPMAMLEAAASSLPVVTTPVGDIPKLIEDGVSGLFVDPGDVAGLSAAIVRLLGDQAQAGSLAEHAYAAVRSRYSSEHMYDQYSSIYRGLLHGNRQD